MQHSFDRYLRVARETIGSRRRDDEGGSSLVWCVKWLPRSLFRECFPSCAMPPAHRRVEPPPPSRASIADAYALDDEPLVPLLRQRIFPLLNITALRAVACASRSFLHLVEQNYEKGYVNNRRGVASARASSRAEVAAPLLLAFTQADRRDLERSVNGRPTVVSDWINRLRLLELVERADTQQQWSGSVSSSGGGARLMRLATIASSQCEGTSRIDSAVVLAIPPPTAPCAPQGSGHDALAERESVGGAPRPGPGPPRWERQCVSYDIHVLALAPSTRTCHTKLDLSCTFSYDTQLELHYLQRKRGSANVGLPRGPIFTMECFGVVRGDEQSSADAAALARAAPRVCVLAGQAGGTIDLIPPRRVALWFLLKTNREIEVRHVHWCC